MKTIPGFRLAGIIAGDIYDLEKLLGKVIGDEYTVSTEIEDGIEHSGQLTLKVTIKPFDHGRFSHVPAEEFYFKQNFDQSRGQGNFIDIYAYDPDQSNKTDSISSFCVDPRPAPNSLEENFLKRLSVHLGEILVLE